MLEQVAQLLGETIEASPGENPLAERLFPRAYLDPTEEEAETQWQELVHGDLVRDKLAALTAIMGALGVATPVEDATPAEGGIVEIVLDKEGEAQLLGVLNDARLALGGMLGVTDDPDDRGPAPDDPRAALYYLYLDLTEIQGALVDLLLKKLPKSK